MTDADIILDELEKTLRKYLLGADIKDSYELALDLYIQIVRMRKQSEK